MQDIIFAKTDGVDKQRRSASNNPEDDDSVDGEQRLQT